MDCGVPKHLQDLEAMTGYENTVSIRTIFSEDIKDIQEKFYLLPGHVELL